MLEYPIIGLTKIFYTRPSQSPAWVHFLKLSLAHTRKALYQNRPIIMSKAKPHPPLPVNKSPLTRPVPVIKYTHTQTHAQAAVTHIEVKRDEIISLDAGVVLDDDPDELKFIA